MEDPDMCYGSGSIAGAVIGTFFATCLLIAISALIYRHWRRNKGKHLVLVTDPEIVEEAYAFDNPCFKDITPAPSRTIERRQETTLRAHTETPTNKDGTGKWSLSPPWANIGKVIDKRRTLDDSCLGPKATRVSVVSLRSRDFTGLGFNVCGNMREGIYVKDLMHRGPASESGRIHPGDRISSIKISFRSMVYEDALTILSYASPYDVELEVESGGTMTPNSKPTTLLKKSVGPSTQRICHPLYRSQSIPELSQQSSGNRKKRLFAADLSNDSTLKSCKSTPGVQTLERRHEEIKEMKNHHPKFGIKVLPALDGTVHRVETQNEHNTNLERRHSKKIEVADNNRNTGITDYVNGKDRQIVNDNIQQKSSTPNKRVIHVTDSHGFDVPDRASEIIKDDSKRTSVLIPSEVPAEVHNAAMAARKNRKSSYMDVTPNAKNTESTTPEKEHELSLESKSPSKGKRKAPAPPSRKTSTDEAIPTSNDEALKAKMETVLKVENAIAEKTMQVKSDSIPERTRRIINSRTSESDTDSDLQHSFTTIELKPSEITVHHTPVPEAATEDEDADVYRKAASLGDLSKYEAKAAQTLERAQSLDMTDPCSKKRKAPLPPPDDINESTEDLTKLDQIERRKLKKSSEWGTLEDAMWTGGAESKPRRKNSGNIGSLERSISNVESKTGKDDDEMESEPMNLSDGALETSIELYNLPLSKKLTHEFIKAERLFDPECDNALARLVNDGEIIKSPTDEQVENEFRKAHPLPTEEEDDANEMVMVVEEDEVVMVVDKSKDLESRKPELESAVDFFDAHTPRNQIKHDTKLNLAEDPKELYGDRKEVVEETIVKVKSVVKPCPGCEQRHGKHSDTCTRQIQDNVHSSYHQTIKVEEPKIENKNRSDEFETYFAKPIINISDTKSDDDDTESYEPNKSSVTINSEVLSSPDNRVNVSSINVVSTPSKDDSNNRQQIPPPLPSSPIPDSAQRTYVTEIQVSSDSKDENFDDDLDNEEIVSILHNSNQATSEQVASGTSVSFNVTSNGQLTTGKKPPVPPRRADATARFVVPMKSTDSDRQVVFVSEYKSPTTKEDMKPDDKAFENWVFLKGSGKEKEVNPWANGASPSQPVTNIVLSPEDDTSSRK